MTLRIRLAVALILCAYSPVAAAQRVDDARSATMSNTLPPQVADTGARLFSKLARAPAWSAPIASAIIPGLGQARLGQDRFIAYMALEAYLVLQYAKNVGQANDNAASYRTIAREVARRGFPGSRPDTVWQYYEKLEKYDASGSFTTAASGPTVPETDAQTYNGLQWILARQVYGIPLDEPNPSTRSTYAQAVAYYESRAIPTAYGWNWVNASLEKDLYVRAIGQSNDASRRATNSLIGLIANHIISSIDAFSSVRLMQSRGVFSASASIPIR